MTIQCSIDRPRTAVWLTQPTQVMGWAFGTAPVRQVAVSVDGAPFVPIAHGSRRAGVESRYPDGVGSGQSGFRSDPISLSANRNSLSTVEIIVRVVLEDGEESEFRKTLPVHVDHGTTVSELSRDYDKAAAAMLTTATDLARVGEYSLASQLLEKALHGLSCNAQANVAYGHILRARHQFPQAIRHFEIAQQLSSGRIDLSAAIAEARTARSPVLVDEASTPVTSAPAASDADHAARDGEAGARTALMFRFESLGRNCELGIVQRYYRAEPLGLLRFAGSQFPMLMRALETRFSGVGEPENVIVEPRFQGGLEYGLADRRYGFLSHTCIYRGQGDGQGIEVLTAKPCLKTKFLARKLIEDLETAEKIFVRLDPAGISDDECARLYDAVQAYGPNTLLCIRAQADDHPAGSVDLVRERLMIGYIRKFWADGSTQADIDHDGWLKVCARAVSIADSLRGEACPEAPHSQLGTASGQPAPLPTPAAPGRLSSAIDGMSRITMAARRVLRRRGAR